MMAISRGVATALARDPLRLGQLITVRAYLPLRKAFDLCTVVICHMGSGSPGFELRLRRISMREARGAPQQQFKFFFPPDKISHAACVHGLEADF